MHASSIRLLVTGNTLYMGPADVGSNLARDNTTLQNSGNSQIHWTRSRKMSSVKDCRAIPVTMFIFQVTKCLGFHQKATPQVCANLPYGPLSKLLVSPLLTPVVVLYTIPYIAPFNEFRLYWSGSYGSFTELPIDSEPSWQGSQNSVVSALRQG